MVLVNVDRSRMLCDGGNARLGGIQLPPGTVAYVPERLDEPARITSPNTPWSLRTLIGLSGRLLASIGSVRRESGNEGGSNGRFTVLN